MRIVPPDFNLSRYGLKCRLVEKEDAAFIVGLRTSPALGQYLHATSSSIAAQEKWIDDYKEREDDGTEMYFIFEGSDGERYGVCRIYHVTDDSFTSGSWVFSPEAPFGAGFLGDIIAREIAFDFLPDRWNFFDIEKENIQVRRYADTFHPDIIEETVTTIYYKIDEKRFNKFKQRYLRFALDKKNNNNND